MSTNTFLWIFRFFPIHSCTPLSLLHIGNILPSCKIGLCMHCRIHIWAYLCHPRLRSWIFSPVSWGQHIAFKKWLSTLGLRLMVHSGIPLTLFLHPVFATLPNLFWSQLLFLVLVLLWLHLHPLIPPQVFHVLTLHRFFVRNFHCFSTLSVLRYRTQWAFYSSGLISTHVSHSMQLALPLQFSHVSLRFQGAYSVSALAAALLGSANILVPPSLLFLELLPTPRLPSGSLPKFLLTILPAEWMGLK